MPSTTFFNLPEEKRGVLEQAARAEFSRVPFEKASINQIIRAAGISRGSFYMYFADKEDLLRYLLEEFHIQLALLAAERIRDAKGDIFALPLALYDEMLRRCRGEDGDFLARCLPVLFQNGWNGGEMFPYLQPGPPGGRNPPLRELADVTRLDLREKTDLDEMLTILCAHAHAMIFLALNEPERQEELRVRLLNQVEILRRGMAAKPGPAT